MKKLLIFAVLVSMLCQGCGLALLAAGIGGASYMITKGQSDAKLTQAEVDAQYEEINKVRSEAGLPLYVKGIRGGWKIPLSEAVN